MGAYALGVDLGTTYTAASVHTARGPEPVTLGAKSLGIPSLVYMLGDGGYRIGEEAIAPALEDPGRLVYEFKRHIGSDTDLLLPDGNYPPTLFSTLLLRWVLERVRQRMHDEAPSVVAVTHPAHWNTHLVARHREVLRDAGAPDALTVTEPEAAAIFYATQAPVGVGDVVAVYDLGGGTFDSAVIRREEDGFVILGQPHGIAHLGGCDFDKVIYAIVNDHLDGALAALDVGEDEVLTDLHLLAEECTRAKEQLSANTHVTLRVRVGPIKQSIRVTRSEFERALRPRIAETITTLEETLRSADVHPSELSRVLLVGGSSRIPLVRAMVCDAMAVTVSEDNDPVAAVAMGAAIFAHLEVPRPTPPSRRQADPVAEAEVVASALRRDETESGSVDAGERAAERPGRDVAVRVRQGMAPVDPPAPASRRAPTLRIEAPDQPARVLTSGGLLRVGRGRDNDLVLGSEVVSRRQGQFHYDEQDGWRFTDLGSRNGTYLEGKLLSEVRGPLEHSAVLPPSGTLRFGLSGPELCFQVDPAQSPAGSALRVRCGERLLHLHGSRVFLVGRAVSADLVVEDPTRRVSSTHLELRPSGTGWILFDVSANGTFRQGSPVGVDPVPVHHGLALRLGAPDGPLLSIEETAEARRDPTGGNTVIVIGGAVHGDAAGPNGSWPPADETAPGPRWWRRRPRATDDTS